jgi:hypothetical protein
MADKIEIPIAVTGAAQASAEAAKVAAGLDKIASATNKAGGGAKQAESAIDSLGQRGSAAKDVYEGLTQTLNGGTGAVFGLAKAWHNLTAAMKANPFTAIGAALLALGPVIVALGRKFFGLGADAEEGSKKSQAAFAATKSAGEVLNELKFEAFKQELDDIGRRAEAALAFVQKIYDVQSKISGAKMAVEVGTIEADPNLNPEEKKDRIASVKKRYRDLGIVREEEKDAAAVGIKEIAARDTRDKATEAAAVLEKQRRLVEANRQAPEDRKLVDAELRRQVADIVSERARLSSSGDPANLAKSDALAPQQRNLQETLNYLKAREAAAQSPGALSDAKTAMDALSKAESAAKEAEARATRAEADLRQARQLKSVDDGNKPAIRALEQQRESIDDSLRRRESLGTLGKGIRDALGDAAYAPIRFDPRGYHDQGLLERDRNEVGRRNREGAAGFSSAVAKAESIASKLGDGKNDDQEAAQLDAILTKIGFQFDQNTRAHLAPLVNALRALSTKLEGTMNKVGNLEGQVRAIRH